MITIEQKPNAKFTHTFIQSLLNLMPQSSRVHTDAGKT